MPTKQARCVYPRLAARNPHNVPLPYTPPPAVTGAHASADPTYRGMGV